MVQNRFLFCKMAVCYDIYSAENRPAGEQAAYDATSHRRNAVMTRTRITTNAVEQPAVLEQPRLYVSSSFFTTSLGCLSYSAESRKRLSIMTKSSADDAAGIINRNPLGIQKCIIRQTITKFSFFFLLKRTFIV